MLRKIRTRLSFSHLLVVLIGMTLAGSLVWVVVEQIYLSTQRDNLLAQARLTAAGLEGNPLPINASDYYSQSTNVSPGIHTRLLDESGGVIIGVTVLDGENPIQVPPADDPGYVPAEELVLRPEIRAALSGTPETAVRRVGEDPTRRVLYAAAPVFDQAGQVSNLVYLATPLPPRGLPGNLTLLLVAAAAAASLLAGLAGIYLAGRLARPLEKLQQAASAISQGDLEQQVPVEDGILELERLGEGFNAMTASLRQSNQIKNAFIADVTHELRTPLTVIKGTVETLEDGALDDLKGRGELLASMERETDRLIRLVNDLLTLTRADASALALKSGPVDLPELARERCRLLQPLAAEKDLRLVVELDPSAAQGEMLVTADQDRTAQVLDNILDNAIRHAPSGSMISIKLEKSGNRGLCSISDQGPGIAPEHLPLIFERFYRVDPARDRSSGGSGLGLAIARSLAEAQGGAIQAQSRVGEGTRITFELPLS
jgi:signal transduction histidine kinase